MKIRKATEKDIPQLILLIKKSFEKSKSWAIDETNNVINKKEGVIYVAVDNNKFIGFIGLKKYQERPWAEKFIDFKKSIALSWIALLKEYRGKGIGSKLLDVADEQVKKWGKERIWLNCKEDRINFYKRNGYEVVGYFMKQREEGKRRQYIMEKKLLNKESN